MRKIKIVADSSANILELGEFSFGSAPLKIITTEKEFVDDELLNVDEMVEFFDDYKGKSKTSCPNVTDWLKAFGESDDIFCITITSGLSGSFSSALSAKEIYETENTGKRVFVIDSLSTGPEMLLIIEKLREMILNGIPYEDVCNKIMQYKEETGLLFMLKSLKNFAANGRVSPAVAKIAGLLDIHIVGRASKEGELEPLNKCRGESSSLKAILNHLTESGLKEGKVRIAHAGNSAGADRLKRLIHSKMVNCDVEISKLRGLCSYYAEKGGILVGFEKK